MNLRQKTKRRKMVERNNRKILKGIRDDIITIAKKHTYDFTQSEDVDAYAREIAVRFPEYDIIQKDHTIYLIKRPEAYKRKSGNILKHAEMSGPPIESMEHMLESIFPSFVDWIKDIPDDQISEAQSFVVNDPNKEK